MRGIVRGEVVDVQDASYVGGDGKRVEMWDVYVRQDGTELRYGADRVSCPAERVPAKGERVELVVNFAAKTSRLGKAWLSAFCVEKRDVGAGLRRVAGA